MSKLYLREDLESVEPGGIVVLTGAEAKHAASVSRVRLGEGLLVGNGRGLIASGTVSSLEQGEVSIRVADVREQPVPVPRIVLAQALAKSDRDELAIQTATELGVAGIIPWQASRSVSRWEGPKVDKGVARWQLIVREASKQAIRAHIPIVEPLVTAKQLSALAGEMRMLVLDPLASIPLSSITVADDSRDILLVVGPEGGISEQEFALFEAAGATRVLLGDTVLRTSSAGPAAIAVLNVVGGRW